MCVVEAHWSRVNLSILARQQGSYVFLPTRYNTQQYSRLASDKLERYTLHRSWRSCWWFIKVLAEEYALKYFTTRPSVSCPFAIVITTLHNILRGCWGKLVSSFLYTPVVYESLLVGHFYCLHHNFSSESEKGDTRVNTVDLVAVAGEQHDLRFGWSSGGAGGLCKLRSSCLGCRKLFSKIHSWASFQRLALRNSTRASGDCERILGSRVPSAVLPCSPFRIPRQSGAIPIIYLASNWSNSILFSFRIPEARLKNLPDSSVSCFCPQRGSQQYNDCG